MVGGGVGAIAGGMVGKTSWEMKALGTAIGAFGGAVAGHYACSTKDEPEPATQPRQNTDRVYPSQQTQYEPIGQTGAVYPSRAPAQVQPQQQPQLRMIPMSSAEYDAKVNPNGRTGLATANVAPAHGTSAAPLSISETANLDSMLNGVEAAKNEWKKNLELKDRGIPVSDDAQLRDFESQRTRFAAVVTKLAQGGQTTSPRQVSRYLEAACANMEIPTHRGVTYQQVVSADPSFKRGASRVVNSNPSSCAPRAS